MEHGVQTFVNRKKLQNVTKFKILKRYYPVSSIRRILSPLSVPCCVGIRQWKKHFLSPIIRLIWVRFPTWKKIQPAENTRSLRECVE